MFVGLGVMLTFQFGASLLSGYATQRDYRDQYENACRYYDRLKAEFDVSVQLLQRVQDSQQVSANTSHMIIDSASRIQAMSDALQTRDATYHRTLLIMIIAQAVGAMLLIYFLVRGKEKRDSILNFL